MSEAQGQGLQMGRWLLAGMLALNIALALLLGAMFLSARGERGSSLSPLPSPQMLRQALPEPRRDLVNSVLDEHKRAIGNALRDQRRARRELNRLLREESLDRAALDRSFQRLRATEQSTAESVHAMLGELLIRLSPAERRQVADLFARRAAHERRSERRQRRNAEADQTERSEPMRGEHQDDHDDHANRENQHNEQPAAQLSSERAGGEE